MIRQYELVEKVKSYDHNADEEALNRAYVFAMKAHGMQTRASGDPYFSHPLEVAGILTDYKLDTKSIITALLHDTVEDTDVTPDDICNHFGDEIGHLVDGVTKLTQIELQSDQSNQAENFRKLVLAMSEDIRVLLVKLADRLHNMRTLDAMKPHKRARKAQETERVFVPLAHYLGAHDVGDELASLAALHRSDDQPQHRVWASKLASALFSAADHHFLPHQRLATALLRGIADPPSRRTSSSRSNNHDRQVFPHTAEDAKDERRNFRKLILQLSDSEPTKAQTLYTSLRPLHERLARHQAVMMGFGWDGEEATGKAEYSKWTTSYYNPNRNNNVA